MYNLTNDTKLKIELILLTLSTHKYGTQEFYDQLVHLFKISTLELNIPLDCSFITYNTLLQSSDIDKIIRTMTLIGLLTIEITPSDKGYSLIESLSGDANTISRIYNTSYKNQLCTYNTCLKLDHPSYMNCASCKDFVCLKQDVSLLDALKNNIPTFRFKSYSSS